MIIALHGYHDNPTHSTVVLCSTHIVALCGVKKSLNTNILLPLVIIICTSIPVRGRFKGKTGAITKL